MGLKARLAWLLVFALGCGGELVHCESDCPPVCGNGVVEGDEQCEENALGAATCPGGAGTPSCTASCELSFDTCESCDDCLSKGLARCFDNRVEACEPDGEQCLRWVVSNDCSASGLVCEDTAAGPTCAVPCTDVCVLGEARCAGAAVEVCAVTAEGCSGWQAQIDCAQTGATCVDAGATAACECDTCDDEGATRCADDVVETCAQDAAGCLSWTTTQNCAAVDAFCEESSASCVPLCEPTCNQAGDLSCDTGWLRVCTPDSAGCLGWALDTNCAAQGTMCGSQSGVIACGNCIDTCELGAASCGTPRLDLLIVVDNSGGMYQAQVGLARDMPALLSVLDANGIDYQIGITTTDLNVSGEQGQLVAPVILSSLPNRLAALKDAIEIGEEGSPLGQGLAASVAAASPPLTDLGAANHGLLRSDVPLAVLYLSAEDDASPGPVSDYIAALAAVKGSQDLVILSAIASDVPNGCLGLPAAARYQSAALTTGGVFASICAASYVSALTQMAEAMATRALTSVNRIATCEVSAEGCWEPQLQTCSAGEFCDTAGGSTACRPPA